MTDDDGKMWDVAAASIIFGMAARDKAETERGNLEPIVKAQAEEITRLREREKVLERCLGDILSYNSDAPITIKDQARQALKGGA